MLPEFWDDAAKARAKMKQLADLTSEIDDWARIENEVKSLSELTELAIEENDEPVINTILKEIKDLSRGNYILSLNTSYGVHIRKIVKL